MDAYELAGSLFGTRRMEGSSSMRDYDTTIFGEAVSDSENGTVLVKLSDDVTTPDGSGDVYVEIPTYVSVKSGDTVSVGVSTNGTIGDPRVRGVIGGGDRMQAQVDSAETLAQQAEAVATATGQHFWHDSSGAHVTEVTQGEWNDSTGTSYHSGANVLLNALGQLFRDGLNNILAIVSGTDPGIAIYDGEGNAADNILALLTKSLIRLGGRFAAIGRSTAKVQFFEDNSALTDLTAEHYIDTTTEPQVSHDLALSSTVTDEELPNGTSRTVTGNVEVWEQIYNDGSTYSDEVTASLNGATTNRQYNASMGVRVIEASGGQVERTAFAVADNLRLTHGTGSQASTSDVQMRQVCCALLHPSATYTPLVGTWNTGTANAWETAGFGVVVTESGFFTDYIDVTDKVVGEFTALVGCTVRVSACVTWVDSVAGRRSVGAFVNATRSGSRLSGGTEYSNSGLFYTGNNAKTAQLTPVVLHLAAGNRLNIGKYAPANAVQSNQAYKMNWVTIEVLSVD